MFDKLDFILEKYEELSQKVSDRRGCSVVRTDLRAVYAGVASERKRHLHGHDEGQGLC